LDKAYFIIGVDGYSYGLLLALILFPKFLLEAFHTGNW